MQQELEAIIPALERAWIQDHGYALVYRCADGEALCGKCIQENKQQIIEATKDYFERDMRDTSTTQWAVIGVESMAEYEDVQQCSNCYKPLES